MAINICFNGDPNFIVCFSEKKLYLNKVIESFDMKKIEQLVNLEDITFNTTGLKSIPIEILSLPNLKILTIYEYEKDILEKWFYNKEKINIDFTNLKYLTNLKILRLHSNFPNEIEYLKNLEEFIYSYSFNNINIFPIISSLTTLKKLQITYSDIRSIPSEIKNLINLESLILYRNSIRTITPDIKYLKNLKEIDLSHNLIKNIPDEFKFLTNLVKFDISYNNLTTIPDCIIYLHNLKILDFDNNIIDTIPYNLSHFITEYSKDLYKIDYSILNNYNLILHNDNDNNNNNKSFFIEI